MLGKVYSALAHLQDETGDRSGAAGFAEAAFRFGYQAGDPEDCASRHHNLSHYLEQSGADPDQTLAHRLAAALLRVQTGSGRLPTTVRTLANLDLPAASSALALDFDRIADRVEQIEGVRFRRLFALLTATASAAHPDGDSALAAVWALVRAERENRAADGQPPESALAQFDPLLAAIAALVRGDRVPSAEESSYLDAALIAMEQKGWMLRTPVERIRAGERDPNALTAGLDGNSSTLIRRLLDLLQETQE